MTGFSGVNHPNQAWGLLALIPGLYFALRQRRVHGELALWVLMLSSMVLSASIIFADNGWRVMYVTWPLVALFLSLGFVSPAAVRFPAHFRAVLSERGGVLLIAVVAALAIATPWVTRLLPTELARISA